MNQQNVQRPCQEIDEISERVIHARSGPNILFHQTLPCWQTFLTAFSAALQSPNYCVVARIIGIVTKDPFEIEKETGNAWFIENDP